MAEKLREGRPEDLQRARALLKSGAIVAVPTETVYGLAAHALNAKACRRVFEIKGRPLIDPLIVHVRDLAAADEIAESNPSARALAERFWPGPLTMVLPRKPRTPDIVCAGLPTVAVRSPRHNAMREILKDGLAVAAPSANPFGYISPTDAQTVCETLGDRIDAVLDGGPCEIGIESTIVGLDAPDRPRLLRPGAISVSDIEQALGLPVETAQKTGPVEAPGQLERHYSPRQPVALFEHGLEPEACGFDPATIVLFQKRPAWRPPEGVEALWLTESGDPVEAARGLYALLRKLDKRAKGPILAEMAPPEGIGAALNDRLRRAAAKG